MPFGYTTFVLPALCYAVMHWSTVVRNECDAIPYFPLLIWASSPPVGEQSLCPSRRGQGRNSTRRDVLWWLHAALHLQLAMSFMNVHPSVCVILDDHAHPRATFATRYWPRLFIAGIQYHTHTCGHTHLYTHALQTCGAKSLQN